MLHICHGSLFTVPSCRIWKVSLTFLMWWSGTVSIGIIIISLSGTRPVRRKCLPRGFFVSLWHGFFALPRWAERQCVKILSTPPYSPTGRLQVAKQASTLQTHKSIHPTSVQAMSWKITVSCPGIRHVYLDSVPGSDC